MPATGMDQRGRDADGRPGPGAAAGVGAPAHPDAQPRPMNPIAK